MDKYKEALDNICSKMFCGVECVNSSNGCSFLKPFQELVDKATPKKRVYVDTTPSISSHFICPVCRTKVSPIGLYCDTCGQALDWSDEDDK